MKKLLLCALLITTFAASSYAQSRHWSRPALDINEWCNQTLLILSEARADANDVISSTGNYRQATNILVAGLREVNFYGFNQNTPISQDIISRGIKIAGELSRLRVKNGSKTVNRFMTEYYKLVEVAVGSIDDEYYDVQDGYTDHDGLSEELLSLAQKQLAIGNDALIRAGRRGSVVPLGDSRVYLNVMESLIYNSHVDLGRSEFANDYACEANELRRLYYRVKGYNNRPAQSRNVRRVREVFGITNAISNELLFPGDC